MNNLLALMHDTANVSCKIDMSIRLLQRDIKDDNLSKELIITYLNKVLEYNKNYNAILDKFYLDNKK